MTLFICVDVTEKPGYCAALGSANSTYIYASASERCYDSETRYVVKLVFLSTIFCGVHSRGIWLLLSQRERVDCARLLR